MEKQPEISAQQAQVMIVEMIKNFREVAAIKKGVFHRMNAEIKDVSFVGIIHLWSLIITPNKRLYLPGELDNEHITIVYKPAPNCVITIESVPTKKYSPSLKYKIYN